MDNNLTTEIKEEPNTCPVCESNISLGHVIASLYADLSDPDEAKGFYWECAFCNNCGEAMFGPRGKFYKHQVYGPIPKPKKKRKVAENLHSLAEELLGYAKFINADKINKWKNEHHETDNDIIHGYEHILLRRYTSKIEEILDKTNAENPSPITIHLRERIRNEAPSDGYIDKLREACFTGADLSQRAEAIINFVDCVSSLRYRIRHIRRFYYEFDYAFGHKTCPESYKYGEKALKTTLYIIDRNIDILYSHLKHKHRNTRNILKALRAVALKIKQEQEVNTTS